MKQEPRYPTDISLKPHNFSSVRRQRGASALEYIVLAAVIVVAVSAGALLLGGSGAIEQTFSDIVTAIRGPS